jgi:hypothetical protein
MNKEIEEIKERLNKIEKLVFVKNDFIQNRIKKETIKEFLLKFEIKSNVEILLAVGYFLEKEGAANFSLTDIGKKFMEAKLKKLSNISDTINKNIKKGFITDGGKIDGKKT